MRALTKGPNSKSPLTLNVLVLLLLILVVIVSVKRCTATQSKTRPAPLLIRKNHQIFVPEHSSLRAQLTVQSVSASNEPHHLSIPGIVEADPAYTVNILPPSAGRLTNLHVNLGDEVKQGQLLVTMQSAGLSQAYSEVIKAESTLRQTREAFNRAQKVNRAGGNAVKDLEQAQNNYNQARADLRRAQQALSVLGTNRPNQLTIHAPISGKVIAMNYGIGSYINDTSASIMTLSNIHDLWISACIPEHLIALVRKGQKVRIFFSAYPKKPREATISFVNNVIDPDTRCNKTGIVLPNPGNLLQINMFAKVALQLPQPQQIAVPLSAIIMNNDTTSVYIETAPWVFEPRTVVLGFEDKNQVRITSGLNTGDRIVVAGGMLVND